MSSNFYRAKNSVNERYVNLFTNCKASATCFHTEQKECYFFRGT